MLYLEQKHKELTNAATAKRDEVLSTLGLNSPKVFYQIITGKRPCSEAEKQAIAKIYEVPAAILFKQVPKKSKRKLVK